MPSRMTSFLIFFLKLTFFNDTFTNLIFILLIRLDKQFFIHNKIRSISISLHKPTNEVNNSDFETHLYKNCNSTLVILEGYVDLA